jgi:hypothetical protein
VCIKCLIVVHFFLSFLFSFCFLSSSLHCITHDRSCELPFHSSFVCLIQRELGIITNEKVSQTMLHVDRAHYVPVGTLNPYREAAVPIGLCIFVAFVMLFCFIVVVVFVLLCVYLCCICDVLFCFVVFVLHYCVCFGFVLL